MKKNSDLHPLMPSLSSTVVYSTHPNPQHHPISPSSTPNVSPLQDTRALGHTALPPRLTTPPIPPRHPPPSPSSRVPISSPGATLGGGGVRQLAGRLEPEVQEF